MAYKELEVSKWTDITENSCQFQNRAKYPIYVYYGENAPDDNKEAFIFEALEKGTYQAKEGQKLWAYNLGQNKCIFTYIEE